MAMETVMEGAAAQRPSLPGVIVAATIGNVLEWFDFLVYGFFAVYMAEVFFPASDPNVSLLITFGTFGLAYVVRPLGALIVGTYTDRHGRKAGLTLSIGLMMIGTILMVVTPGYVTIGIAAPIIITLARILQGFSVGGEFGSAVAFLVEHAGDRKGYVAGWQWASIGMVSIVVSLFGVSLTTLLTHQQLVDWGWRIPYVFGLWSVRSASTSVRGFVATLVGGVMLAVFSVVAGYYSDKIKPRARIMPITGWLFALASYPCFWLMDKYPSLATAIFAVGFLNLIKAGYSGVLPSVMSEQFPVETRAIGCALAFSISVTIFGGFAPFFATWLIAKTGDPLSPSYYLMATALMSVAALMVIERRSKAGEVR